MYLCKHCFHFPKNYIRVIKIDNWKYPSTKHSFWLFSDFSVTSLMQHSGGGSGVWLWTLFVVCAEFYIFSLCPCGIFPMYSSGWIGYSLWKTSSQFFKSFKSYIQSYIWNHFSEVHTQLTSTSHLLGLLTQKIQSYTCKFNLYIYIGVFQIATRWKWMSQRVCVVLVKVSLFRVNSGLGLQGQA